MSIKIRRLIASYIDYAIAMVIVFSIASFLINKTSITIIKFLLAFLGLIIVTYLLLIKDTIIGSESIGKKCMKLHIYKNNKRIIDKNTLIKRNRITLENFPKYPFMIIYNNKSEGDNTYNTEVR